MNTPSKRKFAVLDVKSSSSSPRLPDISSMPTVFALVVAIRLVNIASNDIAIREPIEGSN